MRVSSRKQAYMTASATLAGARWIGGAGRAKSPMSQRPPGVKESAIRSTSGPNSEAVKQSKKKLVMARS